MLYLDTMTYPRHTYRTAVFFLIFRLCDSFPKRVNRWWRSRRRKELVEIKIIPKKSFGTTHTQVHHFYFWTRPPRRANRRIIIQRRRPTERWLGVILFLLCVSLSTCTSGSRRVLETSENQPMMVVEPGTGIVVIFELVLALFGRALYMILPGWIECQAPFRQTSSKKAGWSLKYA
jgi:hypothetical protein